jgi:hypothetical protein
LLYPLRVPTAEGIVERARAILEDGQHQTELPRAEQLSQLDLGWLDTPLLHLGIYLLLAALLIVVVVWVVRRLRPLDHSDAVEPLSPLESRKASFSSGAADALARAGRYGEAIHALLLDTLAALSRSAELPPSLTSREIVAGVRLPPAAREALAGLTLSVEVSRFGGAEPGEADYRLCVDRFHTFVATYRAAA